MLYYTFYDKNIQISGKTKNIQNFLSGFIKDKLQHNNHNFIQNTKNIMKKKT